jgi:hypothetical protein
MISTSWSMPGESIEVRRASQPAGDGRLKGRSSDAPEVPGKRTAPCSSSPRMQPMDQRSASGREEENGSARLEALGFSSFCRTDRVCGGEIDQ